MTINIISETPYFPKAQGVHTAFINQYQMLKRTKETILLNSYKKADITHIHTVGLYAFYKALRNHPCVITAHIIPDSLIGSLKGATVLGGLSTFYLKNYYNTADLVLAVAPQVKEELIKIGVTTRIEIFPNPIDTQLFKNDISLRKKGRNRLKLPEDAFVILGVGQVQTRKGIDDFIEVAKQLPQMSFVWVGGTPFSGLTDQGTILPKLLKHLPPNVQFPGIVDYEDMPAIYNASDIFFFPSNQETQGLVIIEAASSGRPLILRDLTEYKTLYKSNYLAGKTREDFITLLQRLHTNKKIYDLAKKDSLTLSKRFSFATLSKSLLSYYNSLLKN